MHPVICVHNLSARYGGIEILQKASFEVHAGDYVGRRYYNHALDNTIKTNEEKKEFFGNE